jgi:hypothetical protein
MISSDWGPLGERVEIDPRTADSHWAGESLDYDWVLRRLFEIDEQVEREAQEARGGSDFEDDVE